MYVYWVRFFLLPFSRSLSLSFFLVLWVEQKAAFSAELQSYNFRTTDAAQIEFS